MTAELITILTFSFLAFFIISGLPLALSTLATAAIIGVMAIGEKSALFIVSRIVDTATNYTLITIPLFVMMGFIMEKGGIANRLFEVLHVWTARLPGGMAVATVIAGAIMAAMVGVVGADVVTLGLVVLPTMLRHGYDKRLSLGTIVASGSLGSMIPPSLVLIIYGLSANQSITKLFAAALVPGLMLATLYIIYLLIRCWYNPGLAPAPSAEVLSVPLKEKILMGKELIAPGFIILSVLGSMYLGIAAPTEAAALGVAGALAIALYRRTFGLKDIHDTIIQTGKTIGPIMWILFGANALVSIYTITGGVAFITSAVGNLQIPPLGILLAILLIFFLLGMILDWIGIALLTLPVFVPIILSLGYDPVWFGVLFCMSMQIAYLSPPFGPAAFYLKSVTPPGISLTDIYSSVWPFICLQLIALALVIAFPNLALWFPEYAGR